MDTPNIQIYDCSLSWLGTGTSIKSGRIRLVLLAEISTLSEMMWSRNCFPHVSIIPTVTYNQANSVIIKNAMNLLN
jgi:hypothetical protein